MSEPTEETSGAADPKGKSKLFLIACIAAVALGGGAFYAVQSGILDPLISSSDKAQGDRGVVDAGHGGDADSPGDPHRAGSGAQEVGTYVLLDPLVISLGPESKSKHLRVTLAIDVVRGRESEVEAARPRVIDMLQGFLRAVDEREFRVPRSMERLRAQMLRRVQLVSPEGAVRDLLIQEFLLN